MQCIGVTPESASAAFFPADARVENLPELRGRDLVIVGAGKCRGVWGQHRDVVSEVVGPTRPQAGQSGVELRNAGWTEIEGPTSCPEHQRSGACKSSGFQELPSGYHVCPPFNEARCG